ncbi:RAQPRD family integrative conjugative element protein (plasmid) [Microbulbifer sp. TRSA002]|uniref:integrative conjugative element protein, RAQPRD family n=1 Tax=Microbulbifer sp. TRSA002 TaxID=3243382 RepID=UPI004039C840
MSFLSIPQVSLADVWAEREALAKIKSELSALEALVMTAKMKSNSEDRTTFDYEVLLADLRKVQSGISHHLTVPMEPVVPSSIDALSSYYTEHQK